MGRSLAQVDESHVDDVGGFDVALHGLTGVLAQSSCLLRQLIQLVTSCSGVHIAESVVHGIHLVTSHAGIFDGVGDFLLHLGIGVHCLATSHDEAGEQGGDAHERGLPVVELAVEASPKGFLRAEFGVHFGEFRLDLLDFGDMGVPCRTASLHILQLPIEGLQGLVQLFGRCPVESEHYALDLHGGGLNLSHLPSGLVEFLAEFAKFYLVPCRRCFCDGVLQVHCSLLQLLHDLDGLLTVDD